MAEGIDDRATIAHLADDVLPKLIERLTRSELGEIEVREDGWRVRLRRPLENGAAEPARPATTHVTPPGHAPAHAAPREAVRGLVTSPAVGYFTPRQGLEPGAKLRNGDLLGHVDVLGVRHEVVAPLAGALRSFEVQPGQAVEYGETIARLEPES